MYTLHKLPEGFIITSDEHIVNEDLFIAPDKKIYKCYFDKKETTINDESWCRSHCKKVIAQQDQIDFSALSEEEQKEIGCFDKLALIKQFSEEGSWQCPISYEIGFNKAQELLSDRMFTLEDISKAYYKGAADCHDKCTIRNWKGVEQKVDIEKLKLFNEKFIQSLSQLKSWSVELEMDCTLVGLGLEDSCKPKLTGGKVKILKLL